MHETYIANLLVPNPLACHTFIILYFRINMSSFSTSIHQVVTQALLDLKEAQTKGKIPKNPLSETHFLAAWTTNSIKKKRFDSTMLFLL